MKTPNNIQGPGIPSTGKSNSGSVGFFLFVLVLVLEYSGLQTAFLPALKPLPIALVVTFLLLIYVCFLPVFRKVITAPPIRWAAVLVVLTGLAMGYGLVRSNAISPFKAQLGYFLLCLVGASLTSSLDRIKVVVGAIVSVHFLLALANIANLTSGIRVGAFRANFFMGDGNDFAWSFVMVLPLSVFLFSKSSTVTARTWWGLCLASSAFAIVGTQSRGAALGVFASLAYYVWFASRRKVAALVVVSVLSLAVLFIAPAQYTTRLQTISTYEQDSSASARVTAWKRAIEMAVDNPFLGVGAGSFNAAYGRFYRRADDPVRWISTHSVYFKVIAEYGFVGLFVFLMWILRSLLMNRRSAHQAAILVGQGPPAVEWIHYLNMSWAGYLVSAMFLSGISYPHAFLLTLLTVATAEIVRRFPEETSSSAKEMDP